MYHIFWAYYKSNLSGFGEGEATTKSLRDALSIAKQAKDLGYFDLGIRVMANGNWFYLRLPYKYSC